MRRRGARMANPRRTSSIASGRPTGIGRTSISPRGLAGLFYRDGVPLPSNDPDHGRVQNAPRQEDGSLATYLHCTPGELRDMGIDAPPPRRSRHDGWTTERIEMFLEELRATASITDACQAVGMSRPSAYKLYARADSAHIRKAWDEALEGGDQCARHHRLRPRGERGCASRSGIRAGWLAFANGTTTAICSSC